MSKHLFNKQSIMEKEFFVIYGFKGDSQWHGTTIVCAEENAKMIATAIARGEKADWCTLKDNATKNTYTICDCI